MAEVNIPSEIEGATVTEIDGDAFFKCVDLKKVTIPSTVTSIGYDTFLGCTSLENIVVDSENKNYICILDDKLIEDAYIVPGLGDAGDRIFGTK